jgi:hypothetical protein
LSQQFGVLEELTTSTLPHVASNELTCSLNASALLCAYGKRKTVTHKGLLENLKSFSYELSTFSKLAGRSIPSVVFGFNTVDSGDPIRPQTSACVHSIQVDFRKCGGTLVLPLHGNQKLSVTTAYKQVLYNFTMPFHKRFDRAVWRGNKHEHSGIRAWRSALVQRAHKLDPRGKYLDVSFGKMSLHGLASHQMIIAADGLGQFSGIIKFALLSGSVLVKVEHLSSAGEWFELYMTPWKHYVPVRFDQGDLLESTKWVLNNPTAAEQIAHSASNLAQALFTKKSLHCHAMHSLYHLARIQALDSDYAYKLPHIDIELNINP